MVLLKKKLSELSRDEIREELRKRDLPVGGVKDGLVTRLQEALEAEGLDTATFEFEVKVEAEVEADGATSLSKEKPSIWT